MDRGVAGYLKAIVGRFQELEELYQDVLEGYERVDDLSQYVRAMDVGAFVAKLRGEENSPWFRRGLREALVRHGVVYRWKHKGHVRVYRGLRAKAK